MNKDKLTNVPLYEKKISEDIYNNIATIIWDNVEKEANPDDFLKPYEFPFENLEKIALSNDSAYKESIRNMAGDLWAQNNWLNAVITYYILLHITNFNHIDFYKFGYSIGKLNEPEIAEKMIKIYEEMSNNSKLTYHALANFYYCSIDKPQKAIEYFEKYIEIDNTNPLIFNSVGHLYAKTDDKDAQQKQLNAYLKAYELKPDDVTIVKSLLTAYEKIHNIEMIKEYYPKLISLAPTPRHSLNYGTYLINWGNFMQGYSFMTKRFELEKYPVGYPKDILTSETHWNYKDDISDKTLIIHYEEGFGDTIMFIRFLPLITNIAKKIVLILQKPLIDLIKKSEIMPDDIAIYDNINDAINDLNDEEYLHMPLMDIPYPLGIESNKIPYKDKYIKVSDTLDVDKSKINIGIAYSGDKSANYNERNVNISDFSKFAKLDNVQLYSLQVGNSAEQTEELKKYSIIDLSNKFNNFTDTAIAVNSMDLIITSDNVILNLAGAMGKKTYGIFNKYPNYRWFDLTGDDVIWYSSVKPFVCADENDWSTPFDMAFNEFNKEFINE